MDELKRCHAVWYNYISQEEQIIDIKAKDEAK